MVKYSSYVLLESHIQLCPENTGGLLLLRAFIIYKGSIALACHIHERIIPASECQLPVRIIISL